MNDFMKQLNIADNIRQFPTFPKSVKNGIIFLFAGWTWFFLLYTYFFKASIPPRQVISGILACYCILLLKNWARVLCILCNVFIILQLFVVVMAFYNVGNTYYSFITDICIILFGLSSYFLIVKESASFFKKASGIEENKK